MISEPMPRPVVFIITGRKGEGKSSFANSLYSLLSSYKITVGGIIARGRLEDGRRSGFDLVIAGSGKQIPLAFAMRRSQPPGKHCKQSAYTPGTNQKPASAAPCPANPGQAGRPVQTGSPGQADTLNRAVTAGRFVFNPDALALGNSAIDEAIKEGRDIIILDEVGTAEIEGRIWSRALIRSLQEFRGVLLLIISRKNLPAVLDHFKIKPAGIIDIAVSTPGEAAATLRGYIEPTGKYGTG